MKKQVIHFLYSTLIFLGVVWGYSFLYRFGAPGFLLPHDEVRWSSHLRGILMILVGGVGVPLIAEWVGFGISKWLGEKKESAKQFSLSWVRGVILFGLITFACSVGLIESGRLDRPMVPYLAAAGMMVLLLLFQKPLYWLITGQRFRTMEKAPGRFIGSAIALLWNLMGIYLVKTLHEQASFFSAAGVVLIGFGLVIPTAVGYILFGLLEKILSKKDNPIARWNTSGTILFLSWVCFGFIARLTPSTLGQPERWVGLESATARESSTLR